MKTNETARALAALAVGFLFSLGLGIAGMTQPQKVLGFLNVMDWNPSLLLVMAGAVSVHALLYRWIRRRPTPLLDAQFHIPNRSDLTPQLLLGAAIFGVGWGLAGYCPGPAIVGLASGQLPALVFLTTMLIGMRLYLRFGSKIPLRK